MIIKDSSLKEVPTDERCAIAEIINDRMISDFSIAKARVAPGTTTQLHALDVVEVYYILSGNGLVKVGNWESVVEAGDTVFIPTGEPQRIRNIGKEDLVFLCVCSPRFQPEGYSNLED